jgi:hypothetical protein
MTVTNQSGQVIVGRSLGGAAPTVIELQHRHVNGRHWSRGMAPATTMTGKSNGAPPDPVRKIDVHLTEPPTWSTCSISRR